MTVRAVIFDWGGTLTPWHDVDLVGQWYAYAVHWDPLHAAPLARRLAQREIDLWGRHIETSGAQGPGTLDDLFLSEGIDITSAPHLVALSHYLTMWAPHTIADPQAAPLMSALRERGILVDLAHLGRTFDHDHRVGITPFLGGAPQACHRERLASGE